MTMTVPVLSIDLVSVPFKKISAVSLECTTGLVTWEALNKCLLTDLIRFSSNTLGCVLSLFYNKGINTLRV